MEKREPVTPSVTPSVTRSTPDLWSELLSRTGPHHDAFETVYVTGAAGYSGGEPQELTSLTEAGLLRLCTRAGRRWHLTSLGATIGRSLWEKPDLLDQGEVGHA